MKPVHILIDDSYHTGRIATSILAHFGDRVICHEEHSPEEVKIDIFVLSGMVILHSRPTMVAEMKSKYGSENCKAVAVSTMDDYLDRIEANPSLSVDYTIAKGDLVSGLVLADRGRSGGAKKVLEEAVALFT